MQEVYGAKARKDVEWRHRLARFVEGSLPVKEFCQAESVSEASFYRWRKQLGESGAGTADGFIDAGILRASGAQPAATEAASLEVRLELGHGLVLHIVRR